MEKVFLRKNYFFITFPVDLLVVLFTIAPTNSSTNDMLKWGFVGFGAHLSMAPFFFIRFTQTSVSFRKKFEIGILFIAGAIRGIAILSLGTLLELPSTHPFFLRPVNSAITVPLWFIVLHYILDTRKLYHRNFHDRYSAFVSSLIEEVSSSDQSISSAALEKELNETLEPLRITLESVAGEELSPRELAAESQLISSFIHNRIRPLSHKIWEEARVSPPRINFARLVKLSLFELELPLLWIAFPAFIYQLVSATTLFGFDQALARAMIGFLILLGIYLIYHFIRTRTSISMIILNSVTLIITCTLPNLLIRSLFYPFISPRSDFRLEFINFFWYTTALFATSIAFGFNKYQERILGVFDFYISEKSSSNKQNYLDAIQKQNYARYIHSDIQSALVASSIELSRAAESKDLQLGRNAIERAAELLRRDHRSYAVGKAIDPNLRIHEIVRAWNGIVDIKIENQDAILGFTQTTVAVSEILEELVANSVRHGNAKNIEVRISCTGENVEVIYLDNGSLDTSKHKGLGSRILDQTALSWSKGTEGNRNRVRFEVPLR